MILGRLQPMTTMYTEPDTFHTLPGSGESRLIGMHGFAGTGKDTVAQILSDHGYHRVAFATPILESLSTLNPIVSVDSMGRMLRFNDVLEMEGYEEAKKTLEFRRLMQVFGTDVGRDLFGENVWVDQAKKKMGPKGKFIITDVRFPNEVKMVKSLGGTLVKILRPGYTPVNEHISDSGLPDRLFDRILINDGSIEDLRRNVVQSLLG